MSNCPNKCRETEEHIRDWMPVLFLLDVALMFIGIFVANATAWWIWLPFHVIACSYTIFVLYLAKIASKYIPQSVPFQRPLGVVLYLSCHGIQFLSPAEIPIWLTGYVLMAAPLSMLFLFDHLNDDQPESDSEIAG